MSCVFPHRRMSSAWRYVRYILLHSHASWLNLRNSSFLPSIDVEWCLMKHEFTFVFECKGIFFLIWTFRLLCFMIPNVKDTRVPAGFCQDCGINKRRKEDKGEEKEKIMRRTGWNEREGKEKGVCEMGVGRVHTRKSCTLKWLSWNEYLWERFLQCFSLVVI